MSQFYRPDGDEESFEFTVVGSGENTANVRLKVVINVNVDNTDVPITIKNLPVGEYTITEVSQTNGWNWRYSPVGETTKSFVLMPSDDDADRTVRFEDSLTETKWLSGTHYAHFPIAAGNTEGGGN